MAARKNAVCIVGRIWQQSRLFSDLGAAPTTTTTTASTSSSRADTGTNKETHTSSGKDKFFSLLDDRVTGPFAVERKPVFAVGEATAAAACRWCTMPTAGRRCQT